MKLEKDSLDEALLEHLLGDQRLPDADSHDAETAARLDELKQVLAMVDQAPVPHRGDGYGAKVWSRLEPKLVAELESERDSSRRSSRSWSFRRLYPLAAAVILLLLGFLAGRLGSPEPTKLAAASEQIVIDAEARDRLLLAALVEHLGRSERLLTEVSNAAASSSEHANGGALSADIPRVVTSTSAGLTEQGLSEQGLSEQAWAEELLRANRLYRQAALRAGQTRIAALLNELEPIFLELAHAPAAGEMNELRRRVDEKSLLFKVRIIEGRLSERRPSTI